MVELKKTKRLYAMKVIKKELVTDDEVYCIIMTYTQPSLPLQFVTVNSSIP